MSHFWFIPILMLVFLFEGTLFQWLIPSELKLMTGLSPHVMLVIVLYISLFLRRRLGTVLGLLFGLLHDFIYYGFMIGPFAFGIGVTSYIAGVMTARAKLTLFSTMMVMSFSFILFEHFLYGIYYLFQVIDFSYEWTLMHVMIPNVVFHLLFSLMLYIPLRWLIDKMKAKPKEEER